MERESTGESYESGHEAGLTRRLLTCGLVAGPLFVAVGLIQALTIPGFDLTHHYLSMLSAGDLGWIQIANFISSGLLTEAAAVGIRRALRGALVGRRSNRPGRVLVCR